MLEKCIEHRGMRRCGCAQREIVVMETHFDAGCAGALGCIGRAQYRSS
jgi:hypothetical protein